MSNRRPKSILSNILNFQTLLDHEDEEFFTPSPMETDERFCDPRLAMQERLLQAYAHADEWEGGQP